VGGVALQNAGISCGSLGGGDERFEPMVGKQWLVHGSAQASFLDQVEDKRLKFQKAVFLFRFECHTSSALHVILWRALLFST